MKHRTRLAALVIALLLLCSFCFTASATSNEEKALKRAHSYLNAMGISYTKLIYQLEFEGFSHEDAVYAADNCGADWNASALKKARSYINALGISYTGLIHQLEYDGFTPDEARYGADNCGADWNASALKKARSYMNALNLSYDRLIHQLEYDDFTHEQAVYAADICHNRASSATATPRMTAVPTVTVPPVPAAAAADPVVPAFDGDFSSYSFAELKQLQTELNLALWASEGWQKVTVPPGIYIVGEDIPEGRWTIKRAANKYTYLRICSDMQNGDPTNCLHYSYLEDSFTVHLISGQYVEIDSASVTFEPYVSGLGFTFN